LILLDAGPDEKFSHRHAHFYPGLTANLGLETQHASLKRKKPEKPEPQGSPGSEKAHSLNLDLTHRPLSMVVPSQSESSMPISASIGSLTRQVSTVNSYNSHIGISN